VTQLDWTKVGLVLVGFGTWMYGIRVEAPSVQWLGVAFFIAAFLLRFLPRWRNPKE
jgi:hypothetical protein